MKKRFIMPCITTIITAFLFIFIILHVDEESVIYNFIFGVISILLCSISIILTALAKEKYTHLHFKVQVISYIACYIGFIAIIFLLRIPVIFIIMEGFLLLIFLLAPITYIAMTIFYFCFFKDTKINIALSLSNPALYISLIIISGIVDIMFTGMAPKAR